MPADEGLGKGEYYWHEVIGTTVRGTDGAELGAVQDIYRIGDTEVFEVGAARWPVRPAGRPGVHPRSSRRSAARSWSTPSPSTCGPPSRGRRIRRGQAPRGGPASRLSGGPTPWQQAAAPPDVSRPGRRRLRPRHDAPDRRPDPVPGDDRRTARRRASRAGSSTATSPASRPRPARVGDRPASVRRRHALRRGSGDDPAAGAGGRGPRRAAPAGRARHPARPGRRGFRQARPPISRRAAPHLRLPPLRGHRRADPPAGRPGAVDRGLRRDRRRDPALVVIDAVIRLLPGAIDDASTQEESFGHGLLEYPQYTRPPAFRGMEVPAILTSGDHGAVARWRHAQAVERTRRLRPDLLVTRTGRPAESRGRAILRRRRTRPRRSRISPPQPRLPR